MARRQTIGRWGEDLAAEYLRERGFAILARNARTPYGEIDLIARAPEEGLVFVEVKTRTSGAYGLPEEAISARKQEHMRDAAEAYLQEHPELEGEWRCDVIAIRGAPGKGQPEIVCFEDALD